VRALQLFLTLPNSQLTDVEWALVVERLAAEVIVRSPAVHQ
jgi:hypothetical protein